MPREKIAVSEMANRNDEKHLYDVTFASVAKEMAEPRVTAFVREAKPFLSVHSM
jgi:hypothetical protein